MSHTYNEGCISIMRMTKTMLMIIQCLTLSEPNSDQTAVLDFILLHCYILIQIILKPTIFYSGGEAASVPLNHDIK